jgi:hypothetical protein
MSYQFIFKLENAAATNKAVVYTGQNNTLTLSIKNTGSVWNVVSGSTVPTDEDAFLSSAPACTVLYLEIGTLITVGSVTAPAGWKAEIITEDSGSIGIGIIPTVGAQIATGAILTFILNNVTSSKKPSLQSIAINAYGLEQGDMLIAAAFASAPLTINPSPTAGNKPLNLQCSVSPVNTIAVGVGLQNTLALNIAIPPGGAQLSTNGQWGALQPTISVAFVVGTGNGALASKQLVSQYSVNVSGQESSNWQAVPETNLATPTWNFMAQNSSNPSILLPGKPLQLEISNIISDNKDFPGETWLIVIAKDIPGYNDETFSIPLNKTIPVPGITSFMAFPSNIQGGQSTKLSWGTYDVDRVDLQYQENGQTKTISSTSGAIALNQDSYALQPAITTVYTLLAYNSSNVLLSQKQFTLSVGPQLIKSVSTQVAANIFEYGELINVTIITENIENVTINTPPVPQNVVCVIQPDGSYKGTCSFHTPVAGSFKVFSEKNSKITEVLSVKIKPKILSFSTQGAAAKQIGVNLIGKVISGSPSLTLEFLAPDSTVIYSKKVKAGLGVTVEADPTPILPAGPDTYNSYAYKQANGSIEYSTFLYAINGNPETIPPNQAWPMRAGNYTFKVTTEDGYISEQTFNVMPMPFIKNFSLYKAPNVGAVISFQEPLRQVTKVICFSQSVQIASNPPLSYTHTAPSASMAYTLPLTGSPPYTISIQVFNSQGCGSLIGIIKDSPSSPSTNYAYVGYIWVKSL